VLNTIDTVRSCILDTNVPPGPLITTPYITYQSRYSNLLRGYRDPFKYSVIANIRTLFDKDCIVGGFGNKKSDVKSYEEGIYTR